MRETVIPCGIYIDRPREIWELETILQKKAESGFDWMRSQNGRLMGWYREETPSVTILAESWEEMLDNRGVDIWCDVTLSYEGCLINAEAEYKDRSGAIKYTWEPNVPTASHIRMKLMEEERVFAFEELERHMLQTIPSRNMSHEEEYDYSR